MENVRSGNYCFSAISYKMKTRSWRHGAFSWHLLQARFNYVLQATFNNNYNCLPLCKASFCLGDENSREMPTELAQVPCNVSSCLHVRAFSRCWWCAYCVPGLCQVLQVAACAWIMVPLLQKSRKEALCFQLCMDLFVRPTFPACLLCAGSSAGEAEMNWEPVLQGPFAGRSWNPDSQPGWLMPQPCPDSSTPRPKQEATCTSAASMQGTHSMTGLCQSPRRDQGGLYEVAFEQGRPC